MAILIDDYGVIRSITITRHLWQLKQSESPSEETSRMYYIGFRGDTLVARKDLRSKIDLAAANAADAPVDKLAEKTAASQTTIR